MSVYNLIAIKSIKWNTTWYSDQIYVVQILIFCDVHVVMVLKYYIVHSENSHMDIYQTKGLVTI